MKSNIDSLVVTVLSDSTCDSVYRELSKRSKEVLFPGMAVVLDETGIVVGVVTDGDFRRAYSREISFTDPISEIMNPDPLFLEEEDFLSGNFKSYIHWQNQTNKNVSSCLILSKDGSLADIVHCSEIISKIKQDKFTTAIYGMGFVGLTLAGHISITGKTVIGYDRLTQLVDSLNNADTSSVHEPGLPQLINDGLNAKTISFKHIHDLEPADIHIIAVGTPIDDYGVADLTALLEVTESIGKVLREGDQVMLRSTVPAGTTRQKVIPLLEKISGLSVGIDFSVTFAPERTSEGAALVELKALPQIIGSATEDCLQKASKYWSSLNNTVILASSLEEAELVKLANNTFRDVSFAFSNELALLADKFNVNAFSLIAKANEGYTRNTISYPSPGVGGYCLTKDPLLYHYSQSLKQGSYSFGKLSREVNEKIKKYPIDLLSRYCLHTKNDMSSLNVLIVGMAFKGYPITNDLRGSISVELLFEVKDIVNRVAIFDWAIPQNELEEIHADTLEGLSESTISEFDAILLMNNHESNIKIESLISKKSPSLIFDGWGQLNKEYIENDSQLAYSSMGYSSFAE